MTIKNLDLTPYLNRYIHFDIKVKEFINRVKKSPFDIIEYDIRYAIEILYDKSMRGTREESQVARETLKKAGLHAFISKESRKRKTDNPKWNYWLNHPRYLFEYIHNIDRKVRPIWIKNETTTLQDKKNVVSEMINVLWRYKPDDNLIKKIIKADRSAHLTNVILSILAETHDLSYSTLHQFYYNDNKELRKSLEKEWQEPTKNEKDRSVKNTSKKEKKDFIKTTNIYDNPKDGLFIYNEAYSLYRDNLYELIPFLATESQKKK